MSFDEDIELRDLLAQTLEINGCLPKIRAQLRSSVFLALDEDEKISKQEPFLNKKLKSFQKSPQGELLFGIVREFLEYFNLDFTISVFEPETCCGTGYSYQGRQKLIKDLNLLNVENNLSGPLLLHLLKVHQQSTNELKTTTNGIDVDLNNASEPLITDLSKTEATSKTVESKNAFNTSSNNSVSEDLETNYKSSSNNSAIKNSEIPVLNLNCTFDVNSPKIVVDNIVEETKQNGKEPDKFETILSPRSVESTCSKEDNEKDDTYEGTSSIAEDSSALINLDKSIKISAANNEEKTSSLTDQTPVDCEISPPILKESKTKSDTDKTKLSSQKLDKLKSKSNLSSLSDLPPLNKSRVSDILPSLYSKEFKEKSNLKELDKMFDMEAEYEEDFMSGSDLDLSLHRADNLKANLLEELAQNDQINSATPYLHKGKESRIGKNISKVISSYGKPSSVSETNTDTEENKDVSAKTNTDVVTDQSNSSISEHLGNTTTD